MKSTEVVGVRFVLRPVPDKPTSSLIYARVTVHGKPTEICLNEPVKPSLWDSGNQTTKGSKQLAKRINPLLE